MLLDVAVVINFLPNMEWTTKNIHRREVAEAELWLKSTANRSFFI